jgi:hypothetical protein
MLDESPTFESTDLEGASTHFNGTVGTSPIAIPSSTSGTPIAEVLIHNPPSNAHGKLVLISLDGGAGYMTIENKTYIGWSAKGSIKQVFLKGSTSGVNYELVLNRELPEIC